MTGPARDRRRCGRRHFGIPTCASPGSTPSSSTPSSSTPSVTAPGIASLAATPDVAAPAAMPGIAAPAVPPGAAAALVVFADQGGLKCLHLLRRGFRHCFVCVAGEHGWVVCDPLSHRTDLGFVGGASAADLAAWYQARGLLVVSTRTRPAPLRPAPIRPFTCVEAVKRVLGVHAPRVLTPWQLYRLLTAVPDADTDA